MFVDLNVTNKQSQTRGVYKGLQSHSPSQASSESNQIILKWSEGHSIVSNFLHPHGLYSPQNSPGQNTGVGSLSLLQGIFPTQELNRGLCTAGRFFTNWAIREAFTCFNKRFPLIFNLPNTTPAWIPKWVLHVSYEHSIYTSKKEPLLISNKWWVQVFQFHWLFRENIHG